MSDVDHIHILTKILEMGSFILVYSLLILGLVATGEALSRGDFPSGFVFGTASSAYQVPTKLIST